MKTTLKATLDEIGKRKQKRAVVRKLKEAESFALKTLLQGNFSKSIQFPFPKGKPPFTPNESSPAPLSEAIVARLGACTVNAPYQQLEKEVAFIQFLERIHPDDAHLFCLMKDKAITDEYPTITFDAVKEAFPHLF